MRRKIMSGPAVVDHVPGATTVEPDIRIDGK